MRHRILASLLTAALALPVLAVTMQPDPLTPPANRVGRLDPTFHAIVGATVHLSPDKTLYNATVVLKDGRIVSVEGSEQPPPAPAAPAANVKDAKDSPAAAPTAPPPPPAPPAPAPPSPPAGARVWDGAGLHVYAAFVEPYLEVDAPAPDPDKKGVHWNTRVTPQRTALDGKAIDEASAKSLRSIGFATAAISPKGGVFRGRSAVVSLAKPNPEYANPRPAVYANDAYHTVAFEMSRGDGGEGRWDSYPSSEMGAIALIRQTLIDADWQALRRSTGEEKGPPNALDPLAKFTPEALAEARDAKVQAPRQTPLLFDATDELEVLRAFKIADEFSRTAMILGSGYEFRRLDAITKDKRPLIIPVNFPDKPRVASIGDAENVDLRELMTWEQAPTNPRRLDAAGMTLSFTTHRLRDKGKFLENVRTAIRNGLPEARALAMLTTVPAAILGVGDQVGAIKQGMRANLLVTDGPIFVKKTKIRDVWTDGQRNEITAPPAPKIEGVYAVTLDPAPTEVAERTITIDKDNAITLKKVVETPAKPDAAPDAKPEKKETSSKARSVSVSEGRISFVFDHEPFGPPGIWTMAGLVEIDPAQPASITISGDGTTADGKRFRWTATRTGDVPAAPAGGGARRGPRGGGGGDKGADKADAKPDEKPADPRPDAPIADKPAPAADQPEAKAGAQPAGDKPAADAKKDEDEEPKADAPEKLPGLPFGAYALEAPPAQQDVVFEHATVWTCGPDGVIADGSVRVKNGKIVWIADNSKPGAYEVEPGTVVIDARGKHISPGIIDCHSHTGISRGVNEGGQAVTAEVRIADVTNPDAINWYRQLAGGVTAVNNLHGSANAIGGQNQVNKVRWGCLAPDDMHMDGAMPGIKFALGENPKGGNSSPRDLGGPGGVASTVRYPQTRMGVETIIRDRFTAAREYARAWDDFKSRRTLRAEAGPRRDLELETLAEILAGKRLVHCHSYRQDEILMLARVAQEFGFRIGTYQHILEGYKVAEFVRDFSGGGSGFADWWAYKVEVQDAIPQGFPIMHEQGVVVSFNSDSDELARRLNVEAAKGVRYSGGSVSEEVALKWVTFNPARQLHIDNQTGSLEKGKDADLVVWSANPLSAFTRAEQTWIDGRCYFSLEKDKAFREKNTKERQRITQKLLADTRPAGGGGGGGGGPGAGGRGPGAPGAATPGTTPGPGGRRNRPPQDGDDNDFPSPRRGLIAQMLDDSFIWRREYYLDLLRRGLNPADVRAGECGCLDMFGR